MKKQHHGHWKMNNLVVLLFGLNSETIAAIEDFAGMIYYLCSGLTNVSPEKVNSDFVGRF